MSTDVAVFGGREIVLPAGWTEQRLISILGGAEVDATATPGEEAKLTFLSFLGGARVRVPDGSRVTIGGFSFLGGRSVKVHIERERPGDQHHRLYAPRRPRGQDG